MKAFSSFVVSFQSVVTGVGLSKEAKEMLALIKRAGQWTGLVPTLPSKAVTVRFDELKDLQLEVRRNEKSVTLAVTGHFWDGTKGHPEWEEQIILPTLRRKATVLKGGETPPDFQEFLDGEGASLREFLSLPGDLERVDWLAGSTFQIGRYNRIDSRQDKSGEDYTVNQTIFYLNKK